MHYCQASLAFERMVGSGSCSSTGKKVLIADEVQERGIIDHTPVYPREIVKRGLEAGATALILAHNHQKSASVAA